MKIHAYMSVLAFLVLSFCCVAESDESAARAFAKMPPRLAAEATASEVLTACRSMLPSRPVNLKGALILRNRRGIVSKEFDYALVMRRTPEITQMTVRLFPRGGTNLLVQADIARRGAVKPDITVISHDANLEVAPVKSLLDRVMDTDVTWLDLTFDFLWWTDASYEKDREGESVHGQKCSVILVKPGTPIVGLAAVRLWADRKTGCLMQAEQLDESMKPIRRMWGTRVKKFDDRWMVSVLEVETLGSRHRTKITVDSLQEL